MGESPRTSCGHSTVAREEASGWRSNPMIGSRGVLAVLTVVLIAGCAGPPRDVTQLVLQDSVYFEPETMRPFSGDVFRMFDEDPDAVQLTGLLRDGRWNGEMTVYFPNGRARYQGELVDGERCGAWLEARDEKPPASLLDGVMEEIESLAMYPECSDS